MHRKHQREAKGRMLEWRDPLNAEGGANLNRAVTSGVQHVEIPLGAQYGPPAPVAYSPLVPTSRVSQPQAGQKLVL